MEATVTTIRLLWFSLFLFAGLLQAQSFKGHQIGEAAADFLKTEPAMQAKLNDCLATAPHELTPEEIKQRYGRKIYEKYQKQELQTQANGKHEQVMDKDPDVYGDKCGALVDALVKGDGWIDGNGYDILNKYELNLLRRSMSHDLRSSLNTPLPHYPEININDRHFTFRNGVLVALSMTLAAEYLAVREDVTKRLGVTPTEAEVPYHNAYGARWNQVIAVWDNEKLHAELSQDDNPAKPSLPRLSVETQEIHQKYLANLKNAPSPLDSPSTVTKGSQRPLDSSASAIEKLNQINARLTAVDSEINTTVRAGEILKKKCPDLWASKSCLLEGRPLFATAQRLANEADTLLTERIDILSGQDQADGLVSALLKQSVEERKSAQDGIDEYTELLSQVDEALETTK
jgi:hypothetical protein